MPECGVVCGCVDKERETKGLGQKKASLHLLHSPDEKKHVVQHLLELLLRSELIGTSTLFLTAVGRAGRKTSVALTANLLLAVELTGKGREGGIDGSSSQAKHEMESGFLRDVVVAKGATVFELLSGEDQTLLIGGNSLLVLNLLFNSFDGVGRVNVEGNSLTRKGLDENLHVILNVTAHGG